MDRFDSSAYESLSEYIRQREPDAKRKGELWQTAIGLQAVDGLTPSDYLLATAKRNIDGEITIAEVQQLINGYYETQEARRETEPGMEEADKVAAHITEVLSEDAFVFTPGQLLSIHRRLFEGVFDFAGQVRDYNISKREWVLGGKSVTYSGADMIRETLEYDFAHEREFSYAGLSQSAVVEHIARFVANVWQVHPFGEGNTRTTAVFTIKYLRSLGFSVGNDLFARHSWYFRNALVRANYSDIQGEVEEDESFLILFFRNLLMGERNELKNRYLHLDYDRLFGSGAGTGSEDVGNDVGKTAADVGKTAENVGKTGPDVGKADPDVGKNVGKTVADVGKTSPDVGKTSPDVGKTGPDVGKAAGSENEAVLSELVLREMAADSAASLASIAGKLGKSTRHIERIAATLQDEGRIERIGPRRGGRWRVL